MVAFFKKNKKWHYYGLLVYDSGMTLNVSVHLKRVASSGGGEPTILVTFGIIQAEAHQCQAHFLLSVVSLGFQLFQLFH